MRTIVIFSHSRAKLLDLCVNSVLKAENAADWKKILVWQRGYSDVEKIVEKHRDHFDLTLITSAGQKTTLGNINFNRIVGTDVAFKHFSSEIVLGIEEDIQISKDALDFCEYALSKYRHNSLFRGVNLGSLEQYEEDLSKSYSILRYATISHASAITRKTWSKIPLNYLISNIDFEGWDSHFERITKTGFMITPNNSRSLDSGWGGTFATHSQFDEYFLKQRNSFVEDKKISEGSWIKKQIPHHWRKDSLEFKLRHQIFFMVRFSRFGDKYAKFLKKIVKRELIDFFIPNK